MVEQQNLADLPNEVLTQVLSNITGQDHLAKIALVSKQFKDLVDLQLYRHLRLDIRSSTKELYSTGLNDKYSPTAIPGFMRFDRLMNTLSARQKLARQVHTLSLRVHSGLWYNAAADSRLLNLLPELRVLSLSPPSKHSSVSREDSTITFLRLDFGQVTDHYDRHAYSGRTSVDRVPTQIIARHLSLPKLRKVQVEKAPLRRISDEPRLLPPDTSSVDDLRFLECRERKGIRTVAASLCSIKLLKRFVFEVSSQDDDTARYRADIASFERALTKHQGTIEELAVATYEGSSMIGWTLGPFTQFSSLKLLAVPDYLIIGTSPGTQNLHENLPPLLEELQVEYTPPQSTQIIRHTARAKAVTDMQHLMDNKEFCFPRLNRVIWWLHDPRSSILKHSTDIMDENLPTLMEIFLAFKQVGVQFEWVIEDFFKNTPFGKRLCEWQD